MIRLRHTDEFVGFLVLLTVAALIFSILEVGVLDKWFQPTSTLRILFPASGVGGLLSGADVEMLGTHVGTVRRIIIEPSRRIYAVADIDDQASAIIPRDSTAIIRRRFGVAGAAYLDIQRGSGAAMDWSYAVIEATTERAPTESVSALIDEAREKIFPILADAGRATHSLAVMMERLERGEGNVGRALSDETLIRSTESTVAAALDAIKTMDRLLAHLDETGGEVAALVRATRDGKTGVPALLRQVDQILATLNTATRDLGRVVTTRAPTIARNVEETAENLPALLIQTQATAEQLEKLLRQLRGHWLLGGGNSSPSEPRRLAPTQARP